MNEHEKERLRKLGYSEYHIHLEEKQRIKEKALLVLAILNWINVVIIALLIVYSHIA